MAVRPIPDGTTVTPYLAVDSAAQAIEYYKKAFGAKERGRMERRMAPSLTPRSRSGTRR